MPRIIKWPVIILPFLLLPLTSMAGQAGSGGHNKKIIRTEQMRELFREAVSSDLPWDRKDIRIKNFTANKTDPAVVGGKLEYRIVSLVPERFLGRRYLTVIYSVNGRDQLKVKMSGDVHRYGNVLCSAGHLPRGTSLEQEHIITKYRDITMLGNDLPQDPEKIAGMVTRSTLQPGEIIYNRNLEKKNLVKRGDMVTIVAGKGPLKISVPGEIENRGGALGETVKVKNLMSRKIIHARVIEEGTVKAEL